MKIYKIPEPVLLYYYQNGNYDVKIYSDGGKDFINCHGATIRKKIAELEAKIPEYLESFKVLSFDNLALEQLNIKKYVSPEDWKAHYMGDDGSFTMYIDLVKEEFAKNSTSVDRYNLNDYRSIEEIFNKIKN